MKIIFALLASVLPAPLLAQSTLPLSQSTTFQTKANLASPTFTGTPAAPTASTGTNTTQLATTQFVGNAISNLVSNNVSLQRRLSIGAASTSNLFIDYGSAPYFNMAPNTLISYDTTNSRYQFYAGNLNTPALNLGLSGAVFNENITAAGLNFTGNSAFQLGVVSGLPVIWFNNSSDRLQYESGGAFSFYIGNTKMWRIDGNGNMQIRGTLAQQQSSF